MNLQQARMLGNLQKGPVNKLFAKTKLGIYAPAARVLKLRAMGFNIVRAKIVLTKENGEPATFANYILINPDQFKQPTNARDAI